MSRSAQNMSHSKRGWSALDASEEVNGSLEVNDVENAPFRARSRTAGMSESPSDVPPLQWNEVQVRFSFNFAHFSLTFPSIFLTFR